MGKHEVMRRGLEFRCSCGWQKVATGRTGVQRHIASLTSAARRAKATRKAPSSTPTSLKQPASLKSHRLDIPKLLPQTKPVVQQGAHQGQIEKPPRKIKEKSKKSRPAIEDRAPRAPATTSQPEMIAAGWTAGKVLDGRVREWRRSYGAAKVRVTEHPNGYGVAAWVDETAELWAGHKIAMTGYTVAEVQPAFGTALRVAEMHANALNRWLNRDGEQYWRERCHEVERRHGERTSTDYFGSEPVVHGDDPRYETREKKPLARRQPRKVK